MITYTTRGERVTLLSRQPNGLLYCRYESGRMVGLGAYLTLAEITANPRQVREYFAQQAPAARPTVPASDDCLFV